MESAEVGAGCQWDPRDPDEEDQDLRDQVISSLASIPCPKAVLPYSPNGSQVPYPCEECFDQSYYICINALLFELLESLVGEAHSCGKANLPLSDSRKRAWRSFTRTVRERAQVEVQRRGANPRPDRDWYYRLTPPLLQSLPDAELVNAVFSHAAERMGEDVDPRPELLDSLPEGAHAVFAIAQYVSDATNFGLKEFVTDSCEPSAKRALKALLWLGADDHAHLVREAVENAACDESVFADLDNRYRALPDIMQTLRIAIRHNPERFCFPP